MIHNNKNNANRTHLCWFCWSILMALHRFQFRPSKSGEFSSVHYKLCSQLIVFFLSVRYKQKQLDVLSQNSMPYSLKKNDTFMMFSKHKLNNHREKYMELLVVDLHVILNIALNWYHLIAGHEKNIINRRKWVTMNKKTRT